MYSGQPDTAGLSHAMRLSHAYIADGDAAETLAMAAVCSAPGTRGAGAGPAQIPCRQCKDCSKAQQRIHPDIIRVDIEKGKRIIGVDQVRGIKTDVYIAPNEAARKVYIINDADAMNTNAQNAFLQMLEEPPAHALFVLKTANPSALLKTVRSRCVELKTRTPPAPHPGGAAGDAGAGTAGAVDAGAETGALPQEVSQLAGDFVNALDDNMLLVKCMFAIDKLDKLKFGDFLGLARERLSAALRENPRRKSVLRANDLLSEASRMLDLNINVGHISGMLCASLVNTEKRHYIDPDSQYPF